MSAARPLPSPETVWTITIDNTFTPSRQGLVVQLGDQIDFENLSGVDLIIEFQSNSPGQAVYPPMSLSVPNGTTVGFVAPSYNASANYYIYQGAIEESGPFVIQVGTGPMYVQLSGPVGNVTYNPPTVAVPQGNALQGSGNLEMVPTMTGKTFSIGDWSPSDPFSPPLQSSGGSPHSTGSSAPIGEYTYVATPTNSPAPHGVGGGGGGRVVIQN
jgi:hypothetical protein